MQLKTQMKPKTQIQMKPKLMQMQMKKNKKPFRLATVS